jgi:hypothetical protein
VSAAKTAIALVLLCPAAAMAGMPFYTVSDMGSARLDAISFFLLLFGLVALGARWLWNTLRKDFPALPLLSIRGAFGLLGLWSLGLFVVLNMIAGGRELMTPGAWQRKGTTYKLAPGAATSDERLDAARRLQLERLRRELWSWAEKNGGRFPPHDLVPEIPSDAWRVPDPSGIRFGYLAGLSPDASATVLVYEPGIFGKDRLVLYSNGEIATLNAEALRLALSKRGSP